MSRSLLLRAPGRYLVTEAEPPAPGPGEALVRVAASGICGSDRELYDGTRPEPFRSYPIVPGHEWSGTVAAVGEGVDPGLAGAPVTGEGFRNCQVCDRCRDGDTNLCSAGYDETGFTRPGAFAEHLLLPARLLHRLSPGADLAAAALLEPAAVAAAAVLRAGVLPGERVAVVGAGTLGVLTVQLLAALSPAELVAFDPRPSRASLATDSGATALVPPASYSAGVDSARFDAVIETAGVPSSAADAVRLARRGGRVVLTGIPGTEPAGISPLAVVGGQLTVSGVFGASSRAWAHAVRAFNAGLLALRPLVTHELGLTEFSRALELLAEPATGKILLRP
ncbi:dehydrogenase [Microtetraspora sp. NBRC 13810]|uniref:zinc-dependent alcohol dehydrogenase n=1 Tax=Microtetraspora sp. NBRC 13810 TaxID=3030990 RepID=UPI0024A47C16|nr:alcohol dehydrogenase catalytic domain-containing protein [Microtetraspora sp. NBRC 13810]GLW13030.1 dehydrogenase [Microtetraspora sp. NBRC 13810]